MKNLNTALDEKQKEIEIHGNISDKVLFMCYSFCNYNSSNT